MPSRIFYWISALLAGAIFTAALPMHPALRLGLGLATFCLVVGTVVEFVNRGKGTDVVPGSRNAAQLSVDIDQVSSRLAELQERTAAQEASVRASISEIQSSTSKALQIQEVTASVEREKFSDEVRARISEAMKSTSLFNERMAALDPDWLVAMSNEAKTATDGIYSAADDVDLAQNLVPDFRTLLKTWHTESERPAASSQIASRDNFLNEKIRAAQRIVDSAKEFIDVSGFDGPTNIRDMERKIASMNSAGKASFSDSNEIKSWARSQARVVGIERSLSSYIEQLEEMADFAARVRVRRAQR